MPAKSSAVRELLYLLALLLGTGTVTDIPKVADTWPVTAVIHCQRDAENVQDSMCNRNRQ